MAIINKGFGSRRRQKDERIPPGQYLTRDFPVLSAGPTPLIDNAEWTFEIDFLSGERKSWSWEEFMLLPQEDITVDIHCVTAWSKLETTWRGVSLDVLLGDEVDPDGFLMAQCHGGYTTNVPLEDVLDGKAWIAHTYDDEPLEPEHGGPARLLIPHLYFWKSAKWVSGLTEMAEDVPGFWESNGYHNHGDPWKEERYW
ncbi:sulfite oxidase-like oxidoreductase [Nocardia sp. 348MFTsu5.1]|uniref:sulfite oxidase-like oxidoreductase n=1 Tax=Nocardia sp. 348MFTsu5.1 TaxID=1172185 RepID=UPI000382CF30|nr:sulfite oxidase-like oxidoreductase [Nocardia sp. 348MFTsu5.1]